MTRVSEPRVKSGGGQSFSQPENSSSPIARRNFRLGVANGALMNLAHAFEDPRIILSVFVLRLTSSDAMVGLVAGIFMAGWYLPQFLVSSLVEHKESKLPYYILWSKIRMISRVLMTLSVFVIGASHPTLLFWTFLVLWTTTSLGAGFAGVPFLEIIAKTVPAKRRGSFFGTRRFIGGALGIGAGLAAKRILAPGFPVGFPMNYGILLALATVAAAVALYTFCRIEEPPSLVTGERRPFMDHLRSGLALIRADSNYRQFLVTRVLWSLTAMAFPFYAVYAVINLGMAESAVGIFLSLWVGGALLANFVWSQVIDRAGSRAALLGSGVLALASPVVACVVIFLPEGWGHAPAFLSGLVGGNGLDGRHVLFMSTFVLNSFAFNGRLISNMTYLLEMAPPERRPTYIGLANTLTFPLALLPVAGGALAGYTSYIWLFVVAAGFGIAGLWAVKKLVEAGSVGDSQEVLAVERR
jgi:MFS family permease